VTKLTKEQENAVKKAMMMVEDGESCRIGGWAGTGKTTCLIEIAERLPDAMACAFTNKAVNVLRQKELDYAATIHSTIYKCYYDEDTEKWVWWLREKIELPGSYFLVDEASMIGRGLYNNLKSFKLPIVWIGDPGQLEPVSSEDINLMKDADVILTEIHRQARNSGILRLAEDVRLGRRWKKKYKDVEIIRGKQPTWRDLVWADIVICGFHRTRIAVNKSVRQRLYPCRRGRKRKVLYEEERLIVTRNNKGMGVFNNQDLWVDEVEDNIAYCLSGDNEYKLKFDLSTFNISPKELKRIFWGVPFCCADYAYGITCHKAQGSEWDRVVVMDEQCPKLWNPARWRYTAITRAAKKLRYFMK